MMTGWNPGRHGMYDFRTLGIERYSRLWGAGHSASFEDGRDFVTSRRWSGAAFWDQVEAPVAILSVPMTYPAWEVDGRMVSGFPLPDYDRNHSRAAGAGGAAAAAAGLRRPHRQAVRPRAGRRAAWR